MHDDTLSYSPGLNDRIGADPTPVVEMLRRSGWQVFVLSAAIHDKASLFEAIVEEAP